MRRSLLPWLLMLLLMGCSKHSGNFPPDDTDVRLDSTNLPIVWIDVQGDSISRDKRITARMTVLHNGKGRLNYADTVAHPGQRIDYKGYIGLRYRGNSTFNNSPKKSYSLRTLEKPMQRNNDMLKVSLLGMGKDSNWALLAPYSDKSMMRDLLTFELARPWMEYVPKGRYCELFLDGTYYGVYILSEVVSKGKHRLELNGPGNKGDELTGDYLMEVDCDDEETYISRFHPVSADGKPYNDRHILFQYKSPDYEEMTTAQRHYIHQRIDRMEAVLASPGFSDPRNGYRNYIDVMSFIDYQLMMELGHNVDAYRLSCKFFKRRDAVDPHFKMVLWDTNLAYGNARHNEGWRTDTWVYLSNDMMYSGGEIYLVPFWWQRLNEDPWYAEQLRQRWAQYRQSNMSDERIMAKVDSLVNVLTVQGAEQRNSKAWPRWGVWVWPNQYVSSSFDDEIAYLKQWLRQRLAWMDEQLGYHN